MRPILIALALAASVAQANPVAHRNGDWVMLSNDPCPEAIAAKVLPQYQNALHAAKAVIGNQPFDACWTVLPGRNVASMIYEDGDAGEVPLADFKDEAPV